MPFFGEVIIPFQQWLSLNTGIGRLVGEIDECQPNWSLSIIKYRRNATDFGSKFDTTITENHL